MCPSGLVLYSWSAFCRNVILLQRQFLPLWSKLSAVLPPVTTYYVVITGVTATVTPSHHFCWYVPDLAEWAPAFGQGGRILTLHHPSNLGCYVETFNYIVSSCSISLGFCDGLEVGDCQATKHFQPDFLVGTNLFTCRAQSAHRTLTLSMLPVKPWHRKLLSPERFLSALLISIVLKLVEEFPNT